MTTEKTTSSKQEEFKHSLVRGFKHLTSAERAKLCQVCAGQIQKQFAANLSLDELIHMMVLAIGTERDWESARNFLSALLASSSESTLFREISLVLLNIADNETDHESNKRAHAGKTALVLLTEFGLLIASQAGQSGIDYRGSQNVVEYITTNLLARSNVNDNAMRISLLHYLTYCPLNAHSTNQLNRVLGRFGQSLLEDLFTTFFESKKKSKAAFFFILKHLHVFFTASPALSEMAHEVLKHYMLKYPLEFPVFLSSYTELVERKSSSLQLTTKHIALLMRVAVEVSQKALAEKLSEILLNHLQIFKNASLDLLRREVDVSIKIVSGSVERKTAAARVAEEFIAASAQLINSAEGPCNTAKVVSLSKARKAHKSSIKQLKIGEEPSPLESMIQLAS